MALFEAISDLPALLAMCLAGANPTRDARRGQTRNAKAHVHRRGSRRAEDRLGRPFVARPASFSTRYLHEIGLERTEVYIANISSADRREPHARRGGAQACLPYLRAQFRLIRPRMLVLLGATAAKYVLGGEVRIRRDHGRWTERKGVWMMPTFHPSARLRGPSQRVDAWRDFQSVQARLRQLEGA